MAAVDNTLNLTTIGAGNAVAISPDNNTDLTTPTRGLYVGAAGDVSVILVGDTNPVTFVGLAAGIIHPLRVRRVRSSSTTATSIVGVW